MTKILAIILGSLTASAALAALPDRGVRTVNSSSGQFVVRGPALTQISTNAAFTDGSLIDLDPNILAVTCERIKQALLRELTMVDLWRGRVYVQINSTLSANQAPIVFAKPYLDGWQYQVELARSIERPKLVSGLVQVLLLEIANRGRDCYGGPKRWRYSIELTKPVTIPRASPVVFKVLIQSR